MPHRNAVADRNRIEFKRDAAGLANGILDNLGDLVEVNMSGHYLAEAVGDSDKRLVDVGLSQAAGAKQAPVGRPLKAFFNRITSHNPDSPKTLAKPVENVKIVF
jgi:hypothetical protein